MKFRIGNTEVETAFADMADVSAVARQLVGIDGVKAAIKDFARDMYFRTWEADGDFDASTVRKVVGIALERGKDAAVDYMVENDFDRDASLYLHHCDGKKGMNDLLDGFFREFEKEAGLGPDDGEFRETILESVQEMVEDAMYEADPSTPADIFRREESTAVFIQGLDEKGYEKTSYFDVVSSPETVLCDTALMHLFRLVNISPVEFVEYMRTERGADLTAPEFGEHVSDYRRRQYLENAEAWKYACAVFRGGIVPDDIAIPDWLAAEVASGRMASVIRACRDFDRPSAISLKSLFQVLDNSGYGGVPIWYGRLNAREVLEGQFENSFTATGGQIGLHNFENGSGHPVTVENPVLIDLSAGKMVSEDRYGYGPESVHGFTRRALDGDTEGATVTGWVRYGDDLWRSAAVRQDGGYANIHREEENGEDVFWLSTRDCQNAEAGPLETHVPFGSLEEARDGAAAYLADDADWFIEAAPATPSLR